MANPLSQPDERAQSVTFIASLAQRKTLGGLFQLLAWIATVLAIAVLAWLLLDIAQQGWHRLDWQFLTSFPSRRAAKAGIVAPLAGTFWIMIILALVSFPVAVGTALYLEEFAQDSWFSRLIEININNLAGVPSIIYGLLGLTVFVRIMEPITGGRSLIAGALTLALLVLPIIIVAARESLRAVPDSLRMAGLAMGGSRWQVVWAHVLPSAMPGILTGMILALSRAIGEAAPLIALGALAFVPFTPGCTKEFPYFNPTDMLRCPKEVLHSTFTAMPIQIFNWVSRPQQAFHDNAAAAIIVLMVMLLLMNGGAILLRNRSSQSRGKA
ncbi:MAG: phosphate ABC transporter permease PstA [Nodosilinea sp.]